MSDIAIRVENLGKRYKLGLAHKGTLRDAVHGLGRRLFGRNGRKKVEGPGFSVQGSEDPASPIPQPEPPTPHPGSSLTSDLRPLTSGSDFWALRDVSFEVRRGEVLGIIGRNGAGKSTLLKILAQVTKPTTGRAEIRGRVGSLLEVGTGFHPELTGRENVYLNGAILGMTKREIDRKFDEIVDFAGVEKFIDTPVKRYSSGMHVRLGFAVAAHLEPEILVVDEVLAVGDAEFQNRCLGKMDDVAKCGRTILFVSHNMAAVNRLCGEALWLNAGCFKMKGVTKSITAAYISEGASRTGERRWGNRAKAPGDNRIRLRAVRLLDASGRVTCSVATPVPFMLK